MNLTDLKVICIEEIRNDEVWNEWIYRVSSKEEAMRLFEEFHNFVMQYPIDWEDFRVYEKE
jgi:hypothetical protein